MTRRRPLRQTVEDDVNEENARLKWFKDHDVIQQMDYNSNARFMETGRYVLERSDGGLDVECVRIGGPHTVTLSPSLVATLREYFT